MFPNSHKMESSENFELYYKEEPMRKPSILGGKSKFNCSFQLQPLTNEVKKSFLA